jgi:carbonic anhydrase
MRTLDMKRVLALGLLLTAPLWAAERTGILLKDTPEIKKVQDDVMKALNSGNKKHMANVSRKGGLPRVMMVSCADSRIPLEKVFNVPAGEIFTFRAFGNVVDKAILGGLEYGAQTLDCRVLVILGHTGCTALKEAIGEHDHPRPSEHLWRSLNRKDLIDRLKPSVAAVRHKDMTEEQRHEAVVRQNVYNVMRTIREQSVPLWELEQDDVLKIVGGVYHLDSGKVEWLKQ